MSVGPAPNEARLEFSQRWLDPWQEIPKAAVMVMELSWLVPWFQLFTLAVRDQPAWYLGLIFLMVLFLSYGLARAVFLLSIKEKLRRRIFLGLIVAAVVLSLWAILYRQASPTDLWGLYNQSLDMIGDFRELIPPEIMVIIAVIYLTRRGFTLARDWGGANSVINSIQGSIIAFFLLGIFARSQIEKIIGINLFLFIISAVFGMLTARIGSIKRWRGGRGVKFDSQWLTSILSSTFFITGAAAAVAVIIAAQIEKLNQSIRFILYSVFYLITTPIVALLSRAFPVLESLQDIWPAIEVSQNATDGQTIVSEASQANVLEEKVQGAIELLLQLRYIIFAMLIIAAILIVVRMAQRLKDGGEAGRDDERNSLMNSSGLLRWLLDAIRKRAKQTADSLAQAARLNRRERIKAAARIRRIYTEFMIMCDDLGMPRADSQTPLEFLPQAVSVFTETSQELGLITDSYQRVRYGELPETQQEVQAIEQAWKQVRGSGELHKKQLSKDEKPKS